MEMALISFSPSRKRLGILQRLEGTEQCLILRLKATGVILKHKRNGRLGYEKDLALKGYLQSRNICL